jgi:putative DeoR family transcriptional regulator (stage III sporulation protein D)
MEERALQLAQYIIENQATVRAAASRFGVSKSTVHKDLSERLPGINRALYLQAKQVLERNKAQRHIRGGMATRDKYRQKREQRSKLQQ